MIAIYNNIKMDIMDYIILIIFSISTKIRIKRPNTEGQPLEKLPIKSETNIINDQGLCCGQFIATLTRVV